jgi:hypothetical protein
MYFNVPPTLIRAIAYPPDRATARSEPDGRPSHAISPAGVVKNLQDARRQAEITRIQSLTRSR